VTAPNLIVDATTLHTWAASSSDQDDKTFVEFFAGIGLIHEALAPLGWKCALANDNDLRKVATYSVNHPDTPISDADIRELRVEDIPTALLATASFPCIDVSQAGNRQGINGFHSGIVWSFLDHIRALKAEGRQPKYLFLENVAFLLTLHGGESIDLLLSEIAAMGYCIDLVQVDARNFTPQSRNRVFIIAVADTSLTTCEEMPETHIRRYKVLEAFRRNRHLPWFFFDFPQLPVRTLDLADVLEDLPVKDLRWWDAERTKSFIDQLEIDHRPKLQAMIDCGADIQMTAVRRGRRRHFREQIFNLRFDGLASCLRTPRGGSSTQFIVRVRDGNVQIRRILGIESARLQGVCLPSRSPEFRVPLGETDALFAFGDAVCVPTVRWVFEHSVETLLEGSERPSDSRQLLLDLAI
jgi:DNA (cytosine-5)-methyltransferase 1